MIIKIRILACIALLALFLFATGCNMEKKEEAKKPETQVMIPETKIEDVEKAVNALNDAIVNPEKSALEKLCSDKLTYGHSSGLLQNKDEFIDDLMNGPFDFSSVTAPDQTIYLSGTTAIVRNIFLAQATKEGQPLDIKIGNIQVYEMSDNGQWQLLARQAYKL